MRIETERLVITRFSPDMAEAVHRGSLDTDTRRFVPDEVFETPEEAEDTVRFLMGVYESGKGPLVYPVLLKEGGYIGYVQAVPLSSGEWEIGYNIRRDHRRRGYASEAVAAFLPAITERLGIDRIFGICHPENAASLGVLRKCGFEPLPDEGGKCRAVFTVKK